MSAVVPDRESPLYRDSMLDLLSLFAAELSLTNSIVLNMQREVEKQRERMSGNVGGVNSKGVKFKVRERKR